MTEDGHSLCKYFPNDAIMMTKVQTISTDTTQHYITVWGVTTIIHRYESLDTWTQASHLQVEIPTKKGQWHRT